MPDNPLEINPDNVTFVLNALDVLADDPRFITVRKRRPVHRALTSIVDSTQQARDDAEAAKTSFEKARQEKEDELNQAYSADEAELNKQLKELKEKADPAAFQQKMIDLTLKLQLEARRKEVEEERLRKEAQKQIDQSEVAKSTAVRHVQNWYKFWSVFLPPILPLAVAFFVFFNRRAKEREGVSKARLR